MENIHRTITGIIIIALACIFVGLILPGILLYQNRTFFEADIISRLDSASAIVYKKNESEKKALENRRIQLYAQLKDTSLRMSGAEINSTYSALENLEKLKDANNKITVSPYYPKNRSMPIWPLLFFGLCSLIFFNRDIANTKIKKRKFFTIFILLYFFWRWSAWFRNTALGDIDRYVYAVNNFDISLLGFFIQEILSLISLLMLALIYAKWIQYSENLKDVYAIEGSIRINSLLKNIVFVREFYQRWQLSSILLTFSFGYYTYYFWNVINKSHDMRYLPQAIIIHFVWGLSWYVISMPLLIINKRHVFLKDFFIDPLNQNPLNEKEIQMFSRVLEIDPISAQNRLITTLVSGITFLFPLIKTFL